MGHPFNIFVLDKNTTYTFFSQKTTDTLHHYPHHMWLTYAHNQYNNFTDDGAYHCRNYRDSDGKGFRVGGEIISAL